ncbi:MAG: protein-glutamate O-methyltransferase CheR [Bryobacter sp.]|jgi:chemotaxis protein methyltransferase CheR|nr:protein-glutamate O-methyltransferase CheR [Bryobacter sp. CoA8 C33]
MKLKHGEFVIVAAYIQEISAIALEPGKEYLIESRLGDLARSQSCQSLSELTEKCRRDPSGALARKLIDAITTGETLFFRDIAPFDLLRHKLIPDLMDRRARLGVRTPIRIWSAACSTGQELYSVAILLRELLGDAASSQFRLLGTDLSDQAVARASAGVFNSIEMARGLSDGQRKRFFIEESRGWRIRDELRAMVSFRRLNLMSDLSGLGAFDIIFCRNVAIYFSDTDRARLFGRLSRQLEPHGSLIIGSMESLGPACPHLESYRHLRAVYYQLKANKGDLRVA